MLPEWAAIVTDPPKMPALKAAAVSISDLNGSARARLFVGGDVAFAIMLRGVEIKTLPLTALLPSLEKRIAATTAS
jgi:hypothetical protein